MYISVDVRMYQTYGQLVYLILYVVQFNGRFLCGVDGRGYPNDRACECHLYSLELFLENSLKHKRQH